MNRLLITKAITNNEDRIDHRIPIECEINKLYNIHINIGIGENKIMSCIELSEIILTFSQKLPYSEILTKVPSRYSNDDPNNKSFKLFFSKNGSICE